jgi:osmoprotectant transport system permease protein
MNAFGSMFGWLADPAHWQGAGGIPARLLEHVEYSLLAMLIAAIIAIPLGLVLGHIDRGEVLILTFANSIRALPTLGLVTLLVILSGVGLMPPLIALILLAVPPMLVNTFEGVRSVDRTLVDAATGIGLSGRTTLMRVEVPVALPLIFLGIRLALIQVISTATIAAYVGLGGLGRFIFDGLGSQQFDQVAGGAFLVAVLAVVAEAALLALNALLVSPGISRRTRLLSRPATRPVAPLRREQP